jgi:hypothetical protein
MLKRVVPRCVALTQVALAVALAILLGVALSICTSIRNRGYETYQSLFPGASLPNAPCTTTDVDGNTVGVGPGGLMAHPRLPDTCYFRKYAGEGLLDTSSDTTCSEQSPVFDRQIMHSISRQPVTGTLRCVVGVIPGKPADAYQDYRDHLKDTSASRSTMYDVMTQAIAHSEETTTGMMSARTATESVLGRQTGVRREAQQKVEGTYDKLEAALQATTALTMDVAAAAGVVTSQATLRSGADAALKSASAAYDTKVKERNLVKGELAKVPAKALVAQQALDDATRRQATTSKQVTSVISDAQATISTNQAQTTAAGLAASKACEIRDCEVSDWSACSRPCGGGVQTRSVVRKARNGGKSCPPASELQRSCNTQACAVNCQVSDWGNCSASCGGGVRSRYVTANPQNGGAACPSLQEACNQQPCQPPEMDITGQWGNGAYIYGGYGTLPGRPNFSISKNARNVYSFSFPDDRSYNATAVGDGGQARQLAFSNGSSWTKGAAPSVAAAGTYRGQTLQPNTTYSFSAPMNSQQDPVTVTPGYSVKFKCPAGGAIIFQSSGQQGPGAYPCNTSAGVYAVAWQGYGNGPDI